MSIRTPENVRIEKRRSGLKFEATDDVIHWSNNSIAEQVFLDNFSCYLPLGERFFVDSVRHFEDRIKNNKLREEVKCFIYQEAQHSISHKNFNQAMFSKNKLARISELYIQSLLEISRIIYTKRFQLSITTAAEHFTAIISDALLTFEEAFLRKNNLKVARMWLWHAIEEIEHKSVAFDVLLEVTPNKYYAYFLRILGMIVITVTLFPAIVINMPMVYLGIRYCQFRAGKNRSLPVSQINPRLDEIKTRSVVVHDQNLARSERDSSIKFITWLISRVVKPYFHYYRFSFHPWQYDNSLLLNKVKAKFDFNAVVQH